MKTLKVEGSHVPVKENNKFSLNKWDFLKALLLAVLVPVLQYFLDSLTTGGFHAIDWQVAGTLAISTALGYILKNYFSPSNVVIEKKDL